MSVMELERVTFTSATIDCWILSRRRVKGGNNLSEIIGETCLRTR
jgi:hypothetical protein